MINYTLLSDGIVEISLDMPGRSMNVIDSPMFAALSAAVERVAADPAVTGAIITSGKPSFLAGADINEFPTDVAEPKSIDQVLERAGELSRLFRRLETCGKPFVAALTGTTLGGGLELALACHYRIAADNPKAQLGLPEVKIGILPGAGGTQRLPRTIGIAKSLELMTEGKSVTPREALALGIIHEVVDASELRAAATRWLKSSKATAVAPWDVKGFEVPGGEVWTRAGTETFIAANALLQARTFHNYPAPIAILSCVYEGLQVPFDAGLAIETRYFTQLELGAVSQNIIRTTFINKKAADRLVRRPAGIEPLPTRRLGILGAGLMGAGIACVSATAGIDVVLLDTDLARAEKGKSYSQTVLDKQRARGQVSEAEAAAILQRIKATATYEDLAGCDLIIEAVPEDRQLKAEVTAKAEAVIGAAAYFGSNTSTLPITGLAEASRRPAHFIGIHFFSPVEKMPLVEIIVGRNTSKHAIAKALDYTRQIRKTPIVVNDSRGFYTSRVVGKFLDEGCELLAQGVNPALIENAAKLAGMPVGPLKLLDETKIDLAYHAMRQTMQDLGASYQRTVSDHVVTTMYELGRWGKISGKGFYDYAADGDRSLWTGLKECFPQAARQPDVEDVKKRLMYVMAVDAARCLEEGVLLAPEDADVGAVYGFGFATFTGGPLSMIDSIGAARFVEECDQLAARQGPRFSPGARLRKLAANHGRFYSSH